MALRPTPLPPPHSGSLDADEEPRESRIVRFTQALVNKLGPSEERTRLTDSRVFGLSLRLEASGNHTWQVRVPSKAGARQMWLKIGRVSTFTVKQARSEANRIQQTAGNGSDARRALGKLEAQNLPFEKLIETWLTEDVMSKKPGTLSSYQEKLDLYILPKFQGKKLKEIDTETLRMWHQGITKKGICHIQKDSKRKPHPAATAADRALGSLKPFFTFAVRKGWITQNPARDVPMNGDHQIHRPLDSNARRKVGATIQEMLLDGSANAIYLMAVQLSLATSLRREALTTLEWREVDLDRRLFCVVTKRSSHLKPLILQIGPMAYSLLKSIPRIADSPYVFPGRDPRKPMALGTLNATWAKVRERAGVYGEYPETDRYGNTIEKPAIRPHDLRHTKTAKLGETEETPMIGAVVGIQRTETLDRYVRPVKNKVAKVNTTLETEFAEDMGVAIDPEFYSDGPEAHLAAPPPVQIVIQIGSWPPVGKRKSKKPVEEAPKPPRVRPTKANYPSDDMLQQMVLVRPVSAIARDLGVTAKALENRCKARGIVVKPRGYWAKERAKQE